MANLRTQNSQRTESLFAKNHEPFFNGIGQQRKSATVLRSGKSDMGFDIAQLTAGDV